MTSEATLRHEGKQENYRAGSKEDARFGEKYIDLGQIYIYIYKLD